MQCFQVDEFGKISKEIHCNFDGSWYLGLNVGTKEETVVPITSDLKPKRSSRIEAEGSLKRASVQVRCACARIVPEVRQSGPERALVVFPGELEGRIAHYRFPQEQVVAGSLNGGDLLVVMNHGDFITIALGDSAESDGYGFAFAFAPRVIYAVFACGELYLANSFPADDAFWEDSRLI